MYIGPPGVPSLLCTAPCVSAIHHDSFELLRDPPARGGLSWQLADVRTPPGRGVTLSFGYGISEDNILHFCILSFDNDLGHLTTQTVSRMLETFFR